MAELIDFCTIHEDEFVAYCSTSYPGECQYVGAVVVTLDNKEALDAFTGADLLRQCARPIQGLAREKINAALDLVDRVGLAVLRGAEE